MYKRVNGVAISGDKFCQHFSRASAYAPSDMQIFFYNFVVFAAFREIRTGKSPLLIIGKVLSLTSSPLWLTFYANNAYGVVATE